MYFSGFAQKPSIYFLTVSFLPTNNLETSEKGFQRIIEFFAIKVTLLPHSKKRKKISPVGVTKMYGMR
jgi:hypothetical protein